MKVIFKRRWFFSKSEPTVTVSVGDHGPAEDGVVAELYRHIALLHDTRFTGELHDLRLLARESARRAEKYKELEAIRREQFYPLYPEKIKRSVSELLNHYSSRPFVAHEEGCEGGLRM